MSMQGPTPPNVDPADKIVTAMSHLQDAMTPRAKSRWEKGQPWIATTISVASLILSLSVAVSTNVIVHHKMSLVIADDEYIAYDRHFVEKDQDDNWLTDVVFINEGNAAETIVEANGVYGTGNFSDNSVAHEPIVVKPGESYVAELPVATKLNGNPGQGVVRINKVHILYVDEHKHIAEREVRVAELVNIRTRETRKELVSEPVSLFDEWQLQAGH